MKAFIARAATAIRRWRHWLICLAALSDACCIPVTMLTERNLIGTVFMNRLPGLDLLRTIAIVWVMLFHSFIVGGLGPNFEWLSRFGWAGVDIFFVLGIGLRGGCMIQRSTRAAIGSSRISTTPHGCGWTGC